MKQTVVTMFGVVVLSAFSLGQVALGAAITQTITAGPGTNLTGTGTLTFYVDTPGTVGFAPSITGTSPTCTAIGSPATWGCSFNVNDSILIQGTPIGATSSGTANVGVPGSQNIVTNTTCGAGPAQGGITNCGSPLAPGKYTVTLNLSESVDTTKLLNSTAVAGTRTLGVTISGNTVLATPEPGTLGIVALALGTLFSLSRRKASRTS